MSKTGYLIARNRKNDEYFTSSSAYDRPRWTPVAEATVYATAELAQNAIKKLLRYGAYEARVLSLQEAIELEMPDEKMPPAAGDMPPMDGEELPPEDDPDAEMVAMDQDEPCEMCDHCPCTCDDDEDGVDDIVDAKLSGEELPPMDGEELPVDGEELPPMDGEELPVDGEEDPLLPPVRESAGLSTKAELIKFKNPGVDHSAKPGVETSQPGDHDEKCSVPAEVMSDLQKAIDEMVKCAEMSNTRDDTKASFCMTVAEAMKTLKDKLAQGTVGGVKAAQIEMTSWMNAITMHVPVSVQKFIYMGGRKPTLKDMFDDKRSTQKALNELSNDTLTKYIVKADEYVEKATGKRGYKSGDDPKVSKRLSGGIKAVGKIAGHRRSK